MSTSSNVGVERSSCFETYQNSPLSFDRVSGKVMRVALISLCIGGALTAYFFGQHIGVILAAGLAPLPLCFTDLAIKLCKSSPKKDVEIVKVSAEEDKLVNAIERGEPDAVRLALAKPEAKVNEIKDGMTPLLRACCRRGTLTDVQILQHLLKHRDIDVNVKNATNSTALDLVLMKLKANADKSDFKSIVFLLLNKNASLEAIKCSSLIILAKYLYEEKNKRFLPQVEQRIRNADIEEVLKEICSHCKTVEDVPFVEHFLSLISTSDKFQAGIFAQLMSVAASRDKGILQKTLLEYTNSALLDEEQVYKILITQKEPREPFCSDFLAKLDVTLLQGVSTRISKLLVSNSLYRFLLLKIEFRIIYFLYQNKQEDNLSVYEEKIKEGNSPYQIKLGLLAELFFQFKKTDDIGFLKYFLTLTSQLEGFQLSVFNELKSAASSKDKTIHQQILLEFFDIEKADPKEEEGSTQILEIFATQKVPTEPFCSLFLSKFSKIKLDKYANILKRSHDVQQYQAVLKKMENVRGSLG